MSKSNVNRKNLKTLAKYLEGLPADYEHFEMSDYITGKQGNSEVVHYALNNGGVDTCGTAGCAIGHGPAAGILFAVEDLEVNQYWASGYEVDWNKYCDRYFVPSNSPAFEWMFGGGWYNWDNTPHGAAARIRYFLKNGVPADAVEERNNGDDVWYSFIANNDHIELYQPYRKGAK